MVLLNLNLAHPGSDIIVSFFDWISDIKIPSYNLYPACLHPMPETRTQLNKSPIQTCADIASHLRVDILVWILSLALSAPINICNILMESSPWTCK